MWPVATGGWAPVSVRQLVDPLLSVVSAVLDLDQRPPVRSTSFLPWLTDSTLRLMALALCVHQWMARSAAEDAGGGSRSGGASFSSYPGRFQSHVRLLVAIYVTVLVVVRHTDRHLAPRFDCDSSVPTMTLVLLH